MKSTKEGTLAEMPVTFRMETPETKKVCGQNGCPEVELGWLSMQMLACFPAHSGPFTPRAPSWKADRFLALRLCGASETFSQGGFGRVALVVGAAGSWRDRHALDHRDSGCDKAREVHWGRSHEDRGQLHQNCLDGRAAGVRVQRGE